MNRINTVVLYFFLLGFIFFSTAQETKIYSHEQKQFQDALALYNNQQYQAAQSLFEKVKETTNNYETEANSSYYAANAAIRLNQRGADRQMEDFVERYPTSTKRNSAFLDVGDYYFETGKYSYALKWYKKVDKTAISNSDEERFNFNKGYALYASKKPREAESYLNKVSNSEKYGSQAKYYLGYIAYEQDDYEEANERFDEITDPKLLEEKLSYYQADLNFKLGNFNKAIEMAQKQIPKSDRREVSELNKIIGESYFNLKNYNEAIPYLKKYKGKRGRFNNTDYYLLGYSYYKQGDFESAIGQFNKIIGGANSVAQNAYYHLAECYLKLDKKSEALNAFRNASQMTYNADIEKDALLNYARLSYEIGNAYEPVPQVITNYLDTYPRDEHQEELQELLVDSYITSKNFEGALQLLEKNSSYASDETYQKVAYYSGVELFVDNKYDEALARFKKSLKKSKDPIYKARSQYWKAESAYRLNQFDDALVGFTNFKNNPNASSVPEYNRIDYNLGYSYFKVKDYNNAIRYFKNVTVNGANEELLNDSYIRLGDSYFVTSNYNSAITAYEEATKREGNERDYAAFQKAISNGFLGNNRTKINDLNSFLNRYTQSTLQDDALFELGNTYIKTDEETKGLAAYDRLLSTFSKSKFAPKALLRQGLVHYNANRNEQALTKLKAVVAAYPNTAEARQAVATAKLVYIDLGRVSEYAAWVKNLDFIEVTDTELDAASFEAADRKYAQGNTEAAIRAYEDYLKEFPNGLEVIKANFNLAQLYFAKGEKEKALTKFRVVAESGTGEYTEQAYTRVCEIYVSREDYQSAIPYLQQLENIAEIRQNKTFAQSNLMKGYYEQKNYEQTLIYADKVLNAPQIDNRIRSDAQIMIARSAIATGDEQLAEDAFTKVKKIATGETAAEAWYYDAYFKNKNQNFEASNVSVQKLAKDYASYKKWGGKGLVLMAKNFYALDDAFQATYILESVIENFAEFNDIVSEAQEELALIKSQEAEKNSSVNPNEN